MAFWKTIASAFSEMVKNIINSVPYLPQISAIICIFIGFVGRGLGLISDSFAIGLLLTLALAMSAFALITITRIEINQNNQISAIEKNGIKIEEISNKLEFLDHNSDVRKKYDKLYKPESSLIFTLIKSKVVADAEHLIDLIREGRSKLLMPEQSFPISISIINSLGSNDVIIAIDSLKDYEWNKTECWRKYIHSNETAALNGAAVHRIFRTPEGNPETWLDPTKIIITKHENPYIPLSKGGSKGGKMIGYFVSEETYKLKIDTETRDIINDGFILIKRKDEEIMMAVTDHRLGDEYRTKIRIHPDETKKLWDAFIILTQYVDEKDPEKHEILCRSIYEVMRPFRVPN